MSRRINNLFSGIYEKYDMMNHLFSLGFDIRWRKKAAQLAFIAKQNINILDFGTGTGDLAFELHGLYAAHGIRADITGLDFNSKMLSVGMRKAKERGITDIRFARGDAAHTGYRTGSFDLIVSGFTLRNIDNLSDLSAECRRLLRPGGRIMFLDMAYPDNALEKAYFDFHLSMMGIIGSAVNKEAYTWLVESIRKFDKQKLINILSKDFKDIETHMMTPGIAYAVIGKRR